MLALTAFIVNPNLGVWAATPWRPWPSIHSCVSSYWVAARMVTAAPNLYAESVYRPRPEPDKPRKPNLGPFLVDVYEYPPTFLPLPRLMAAATPDFWQFRRLWFALNLAGVALCLVAIARRFDTALGTQAVWLTPWVLASPSIVGTLQAGNAHLLFIGAAVAAMLLFERQRHAAGGAILAYAIVSKLFPGVLLFYLLLRRDWRAVGWTAAWSVALAALTLADVGTVPFAAFLEHLPKLLSGEAFPAFRSAPAIAVNESIPGLVFKIGLLGGPSLGFGASRILGWAYTLVVVGVTAWLALRPARRGREPLVWIVILVLATMRSPFLPMYGAVPIALAGDLDCGARLAAAACAMGGRRVVDRAGHRLQPELPATAGHRRLDVRPHRRRLRAGGDGDPTAATARRLNRSRRWPPARSRKQPLPCRPDTTMPSALLRPFPIFVLAAARPIAAAHQREVEHEAQREGHEPRVGVERVEERRIGDLPARRHRRAHEAGHHRQHGEDERDHRRAVDAVRVGVAPADVEQIAQRQLTAGAGPSSRRSGCRRSRPSGSSSRSAT